MTLEFSNLIRETFSLLLISIGYGIWKVYNLCNNCLHWKQKTSSNDYLVDAPGYVSGVADCSPSQTHFVDLCNSITGWTVLNSYVTVDYYNDVSPCYYVGLINVPHVLLKWSILINPLSRVSFSFTWGAFRLFPIKWVIPTPKLTAPLKASFFRESNLMLKCWTSDQALSQHFL